jgi:hypothetical protein
VEGLRNRLHRRLTRGLLMASKASRRSASRFICQVWLWQTLFCFREAKSKPTDLWLSQGGLIMNGGSCLNQHQKRVCRCILAVDGTLQTIQLNGH